MEFTPPDEILPPDIALFDRFQEAARGHIRLMTAAPEMPGALDLMEHATAQGVRVSIGHTNASAAETNAAIGKGASSATHLFNAMRSLDHREPGVIGVVLSNPDLFAELICDGIHVAPELVEIFLRCKGWSGRFLLQMECRRPECRTEPTSWAASMSKCIKAGPQQGACWRDQC